jgi:pSer/pThr/pTyr-binding forkhead associated (FHA) protein
VIEGDSYVSGLHCQLEVSDEVVTLTDLGSTNGTFIGDDRIEPNTPHELPAGTTFRVGQTELLLDGPAPVLVSS